MTTLYNLLMIKVEIILSILKLFNVKIQQFVNERKNVIKILEKEISKNEKYIWIHVASLGEFEQAIPIIEEINKHYIDYKILVTFFSPSGYEIIKNYNKVDVVCYLPLDSRRRVKKFIQIVNPKLVFFVKYEFWPNLLNELKRKEIPTILVSGIFRKQQIQNLFNYKKCNNNSNKPNYFCLSP